MNRICIAVSDAIWNSIREGTELTEEQLLHIQDCDSCAEVLAEAQVSLEALRCAKAYPAVPDCRAAVMGRIGSRRARFSPVWAYACAVLVVVVVVGGFALHPGQSPSSSTPRIAKNPTVAQPAPLQSQEPKNEVVLAPDTKEPSVPRPHKGLRPASNHRKQPTSYAPVPTIAKLPPKPAAASQDEPAALVYVTWETGANAADVDAYSYTVTDPATGEATDCTVKREGNDVEIEMESNPVELEKKPAKESKVYETLWHS